MTSSVARIKEHRSLFRLWARDALIPLFIHLPPFEGDGAPTRRMAWIARPEVGPLCNGPGREAFTPRALRRANAASSAYASISDRATPGALCPWRVFPEAARGSGLRNS